MTITITALLKARFIMAALFAMGVAGKVLALMWGWLK